MAEAEAEAAVHDEGQYSDCSGCRRKKSTHLLAPVTATTRRFSLADFEVEASMACELNFLEVVKLGTK